MSARTGRFGVFGPGSGKANAAGAVVACAVMLLAGCGGSDAADAGAPVIRGDVSGTSSVTAVAGVGQVVVSWPESQTSSTQSVTGYEVQVSTDSGGTWAGAGTGCAKDTTTKSTALTCTATGLAAGTYSFRIATLKKNPNTKATKTTDFSTGSTGVTVVAAPGAPAQPTAVAGDGRATVTVADGKLGGTPTSYTVTAVNASGKSCTVTGASGSCPVTGLTNGTAYTFTATATNTTGTSGSSPESAPVTWVAAPGAPAAPTAVAGDGQATVTVTDGKLGGTPTSYTVTAVNASGKSCTVTGASGSCPVTGLTNGTTYTFTATATNTTGTSGSSPASGSAIPAAAATSTTTGPANRGYVLWFNDSKGIGYITPYDGGENLFVHFSAINVAGYKTLTAGECVRFEKGQVNGVLNAGNIQDAPCWP